MRQNYEKTLKFIMDHEGARIVNDPVDHGGLTAAYGLTLATMKALKLDLNQDGTIDKEDIVLVTKKVIDQAFRKYFWDVIKGDNLPGGIDLILADVAWNSGPGKVKQFVKEGFATDIERLTERRIAFYEYRVQKDPSQERFINGWKNRANDALREADKCFK